MLSAVSCQLERDVFLVLVRGEGGGRRAAVVGRGLVAGRAAGAAVGVAALAAGATVAAAARAAFARLEELEVLGDDHEAVALLAVLGGPGVHLEVAFDE